MIRTFRVLIACLLLVLGLTACSQTNVAPTTLPEHELFTQEEIDSFSIEQPEKEVAVHH